VSTIPLDIQRRFEQRWAARFGPAAVKAKSAGLKPATLRRARRKCRRVESEGLKSASPA
jgi:hypothetical protein